MSTDLTPAEATELQRHEATIRRGLKTFVEVGTALVAIRDGRLYRAEHGTFEDYCRERWGMTKSRANQLVDAAAVVGNLTTTVVIPENERQIRPLARLEPEQQCEAWTLAVEAAPNGRPTARDVEVAAERVAPRPAPTVPHNERLFRWLRHVASETHVINVEMGGIGALLAEPDRWNWVETRGVVLPMIEALIETLNEFHREISAHATQQAGR